MHLKTAVEVVSVVTAGLVGGLIDGNNEIDGRMGAESGGGGEEGGGRRGDNGEEGKADVLKDKRLQG